MKKIRIWILTLMVLLFAHSAFAYVSEGQLTLSPQVGGYTFDKTQHLRTFPVYGIRLGYNFSDHVGVEGGFDYSFTRSTSTWYDKKVDFFKVNADVIYNFMPDSKIVPYLAAGGGAYSFYGPSYIVSKQTKGLLDYGAGLKLYLNDKYAIRADGRHVIAASGTDSSSYNNFEYTLGVLVSFGGSKPAAKPVAAAAQAATQPAAPAQPAEKVCPPCPEPVKCPEPQPVAAPVAKVAQEQVQIAQPAAAPAPVAEPAPAVVAAAAAAPAAQVVQPVIHDVIVGSNFIEIKGDRPFNAFQMYSLSKPLRQIIDFPGAATDMKQKTVSVKRFGVTQARVESLKSQLRVTLDTKLKKFPLYWVEVNGNSMKILFVPTKAPTQKKPAAPAEKKSTDAPAEKKPAAAPAEKKK